MGNNDRMVDKNYLLFIRTSIDIYTISVIRLISYILKH
jgi:hypothetical protein